jgi:hypothetical protein
MQHAYAQRERNGLTPSSRESPPQLPWLFSALAGQGKPPTTHGVRSGYHPQGGEVIM